MLIKRIFFYTAIILMGCVLGANVYNSVVDAPNWGSALPASLDTAKTYFATANPGTFYRVASPAAQAAALLCLIFAWRSGGWTRGLAAAALLLTISGDVLTFTYFYPRNAIMFGPRPALTEDLINAWSTWSTMNHLRSAIILAALIAELAALSGLERKAVESSLR